MQLNLPYHRGQKKPWPSLPRINWSHPLARGLVFYAYDTGTGLVVDLVSGAKPTTLNTRAGATTSPFGMSTKYPGGGTSCSYIWPVIANVNNILVSSRYSMASAWYYAVLPGSFACILGINDTGQTTQASFLFDSGATNDMQWSLGNTNPTPFTANTANAYHSLVGTNTGAATQNIYFDGALKTTTALTATVTTTTAKVCMGSTDPASTGLGNNQQGWVFYGAIWNRTISAPEAQQLHTDPWSFLIYPEDEMFATLVGVSAATVPRGWANSNVAPIANIAASVAIAAAAGLVWVPQPIAATPNTVPAGWYQPLSTAPPVAQAIQTQAFVPFNTPQVTTTPSGWQSIPSSAPAVAKVPTTSALTFVVPPFPVPTGWQSTTAFVPPVPAPIQGSFFVPFDTRQTNTATIDKWQQPLSTPVLSPPVQLGATFVPFNTAQINTAPLGWYQSLATTPPIPPAQQGFTSLSYFIAPTINTIQGTGWYQALAATPPSPLSQIGATFVPFDTAQITSVSPYGWYQPLSLAPLVAQAIYPQPAWFPAPFPTFTLAWQQPLAVTPSSPPVQPGAVSLAYSISPIANTVVGMPWQQPLSIPVPVAVSYQSSFFVPFDTAQTIVTVTLIQRTLTGVGL